MSDWHRRSAFGFLSLAVVLASCFQPSEQRAQRDLEVGRASGGGASVVVERGLAAVRGLSPGTIELWGSAPTLVVDVRIEAGAPTTWTLDIRNAMPSAELVATADGAALVPTLIESELSTRKQWRLEVTPPTRLSLRVATPEADQEDHFRFAVLSDIQEAIDRVQDIFDRINREPDLAFVWTSGDLSDSGTADQMDRVQQELRQLGIPIFGTLGNHDTFHEPTPWHDRFGRCNTHFAYRGVAFTGIDSADGTVDPMVYDWLGEWLDAAKQRTHVVVTHIPILDPIGVRGGGFASRNEAAKLLAKLAEGRVDALFYGHIHSFYAFENAGIPAYISGGGGAIPERFDGIGRHFLVVDVDPSAGLTSVERVDVD